MERADSEKQIEGSEFKVIGEEERREGFQLEPFRRIPFIYFAPHSVSVQATAGVWRVKEDPHQPTASCDRIRPSALSSPFWHFAVAQSPLPFSRWQW